MAIELPVATRARLAELQVALGVSGSGWRWVRPESLHLTLRFLGEVPDGLDASAREAWRGAAAGGGPFTLRAEGIGVFPSPGRPRILWVGLREIDPGDRLAALAEAVERAACGLGLAPAERAFRPHLTIARAARDARPSAPTDPGWADPDPFVAHEMVLLRSELHPSGARYTALARYRLGGETIPPSGADG